MRQPTPEERAAAPVGAVAADFLNSAPGTGVPLDFDPQSPARFFNRELSWLGFDARVLDEAENTAHPLLERVRFLAISGENLDEFFVVRVAGLLGLLRGGHEAPSIDGRTPAQQLRDIAEVVRRLESRQQDVWARLREELRAAGVHVLEAANLDTETRSWLDRYFVDQVLPLLTPLAVDPAHPFPFIPNKGLVLAMQLTRSDGAAEREGAFNALLPIPPAVDRFVRLPDSLNRANHLRYIRMESVILYYVDRLFPGYTAASTGLFRVLRDSDIEVEEEAEDLVREFETALKRRRRGDVIHLSIEAGAPDELKDHIVAQLRVARQDVVELEGMVGLSDLAGLITGDRPDLIWQPFVPRMPERVRDHQGDIFSAIRQKDMLLHHPYESFEIVVNYLRQATRDPDVLAIKQTLYRTSQGSPIVAALCEAAEAGKSVTAVVELKARFDEAANIGLARQLERAGVQVVFGFLGLKTHGKLSLVIRRESGTLVSYAHFGTGNYHPITARVYTDLSLFTCDRVLNQDAARIFNYITGYATPIELEQAAVAPVSLKETLLAGIEAEIGHAEAGRPAAVWAKLNALIHPEIIDALYRASGAGVRIDLVVRGICGLRPGIRGISENIRVKSIVGRFLEHGRIACFGNGEGLPGADAQVYISSADWMPRNLDRRIETLVAIRNPTVRAQILDQVMAANLRDEEQSWLLQPDGRYIRYAELPEAEDRDDLFNCHEFFMRYPSLSGRGRGGADDAPRLTLGN